MVGGVTVAAGETRDLSIRASQSFSGADVSIPARVIRAAKAGPVVLLTGAVHGDELNGTGIIRDLLLHPPFELTAGTLVMAPVVNLLGFDRQSRYLPDRRDLNRSFPGSAEGSLTRRYAHAVFHQLVAPCDLIIDLHTGGGRRTNFPNVRANMADPEIAELARAFGSEIIFDHAGGSGTLRRTASERGIPTILLEGGEVLKVEPSIVEVGVRGVTNVLASLDMIAADPAEPLFRAEVDRSMWIRSDAGGMLRFHAGPGDLVAEGQPLASVSTLLGSLCGEVLAPAAGLVMGATTLPSVKPGDPILHLGMTREDDASIRWALDHIPEDSLYARLRRAFAESIVIEPPGSAADPA